MPASGLRQWFGTHDLCMFGLSADCSSCKIVTAVLVKSSISVEPCYCCVCIAGLKREWLIGQQLNTLSEDETSIPGTTGLS